MIIAFVFVMYTYEVRFIESFWIVAQFNNTGEIHITRQHHGYNSGNSDLLWVETKYADTIITIS